MRNHEFFLERSQQSRESGSRVDLLLFALTHTIVSSGHCNGVREEVEVT